jgi:hypothetical protein
VNKQKHNKRIQIFQPDNLELVVADVPVKISFFHGEKMLQEYEDVIDIDWLFRSMRLACVHAAFSSTPHESACNSSASQSTKRQ